MFAVRQRRFHRFGHGQLAGTVFVIRMPLRKRAVPREETVHAGNGFDIGGHAGVNSIVALRQIFSPMPLWGGRPRLQRVSRPARRAKLAGLDDSFGGGWEPAGPLSIDSEST